MIPDCWSWRLVICHTWKMKIILLILIFLRALAASADSHTLRYYFTRVSYKGFSLPEFSIVGYVDDKEFISYDTESQLVHPVARWMERNEGPEFGDGVMQISKSMEPFYRHEVKNLMRRLNQTGGFHSLQEMFGCELRDDGSTLWYVQYGYDGRNFMYLDTQRGLYIPEMNAAQVTTQRWNSPEIRKGERDKNYLENQCLDLLKKYVECGKEDLEKRVCPEVKVWGRCQSDGLMRLQCLVYGFHPRAVDVKWVRNGVDDVPSDEISPILPHPDGTYQIRVSVEVPTREGDTYACYVDHSSLGTETLSVKWEPNNATPMSRIIGVTVACFVMAFAAIAGGIFLYRKRKYEYKATSTSDSHSDSSNNPRPDST